MAAFPVLLADIGGTNTRFALWSGRTDSHPEHILIYPTSQFSTLEIAIKTYLTEQKQPLPPFAAFCLACPIHGDQVTLKNHSWSFSITQLKNEMGFKDLIILNDFVAVAHALPYLSFVELEAIQSSFTSEAPSQSLTRLAIGLGTGLGAAISFYQNQSWHVYPSEAGHAVLTTPSPFYPEVVQSLFKKDPILVNEHVLSGPGLIRLYHAVCNSQHQAPQNWNTEMIIEKAASGEDALCYQTTQIFSHWFGICTGSLVITLNAWGGVYIAGGVIRNMRTAFDVSLFLQGFHLPGKLRSSLTKMPIYLITQPYSAFTGLISQISPRLSSSYHLDYQKL